MISPYLNNPEVLFLEWQRMAEFTQLAKAKEMVNNEVHMANLLLIT